MTDVTTIDGVRYYTGSVWTSLLHELLCQQAALQTERAQLAAALVTAGRDFYPKLDAIARVVGMTIETDDALEFLRDSLSDDPAEYIETLRRQGHDWLQEMMEGDFPIGGAEAVSDRAGAQAHATRLYWLGATSVAEILRDARVEKEDQ